MAADKMSADGPVHRDHSWQEVAQQVEQAARGEEGATLAGGSLNGLLGALSTSLLPVPSLGRVVDVASDASLEEAIRLLSSNGILSAPVRDVAAPADSSWIDRYIGVVDFPGIVLWVLNHNSVAALNTPRASTSVVDASGAEEGAPESSSRAASAGEAEGEAAEDLFSLLQSSAELRSTKVSDISGSFRWAPFLPLTRDDTLLTLLLLLSTYRARVVPIVEPGQGALSNIITQTTVARLLATCVGAPALQELFSRPLGALGLPAVQAEQMVKVEDSDPVLEPFRLMLRKGIGGVPVVHQGTQKVAGSISVRDIQLLLLHPRLLQDHRSLSVAEFLQLARDAVPASPGAAAQAAPLTVSSDLSVGALLRHLDGAHTPRAYVTDAAGDLLGVVTLRDVIARLVSEPPGYFGDFFQGVVPARPS